MNKLKIDEEKTLHLLQELIRIESVNPSITKESKGEREISHFIGDYLKNLGLIVEYQEIKDGRENVIGILKGTENHRTLMLNGHLDTVHIKGMEIEPLNPIYKDGKVYGRGSYDMKGGLVAMIMAIETIVNSNQYPKGDVMIACVVDEEYTNLGTQKLVEKYSADAAIVCEATSLQILLTHGGFAWATVDFYGKASHGCYPEIGIDAIMKAGLFLAKLDKFNKEKLSQITHPLLGCATVHASFIDGGLEMSTYPDHCRLKLERRLLPGEDGKNFLNEIKEIIEDLKSGDPDFKAEQELFFYRNGIEISKEQPIVQSLGNSIKKVLQDEPEYCIKKAWMDSGLLHGAGIPTTVFGTKGAGAHQAIEYVDFKSVIDMSEVLINVIFDFLG